MTNTAEALYYLNQDTWKQNNNYSTYPRQTYMNSFERSMETIEIFNNKKNTSSD